MSKSAHSSQIAILVLILILLGINMYKLFESNEAYCDTDAQCRAGKEKCVNKNCIPIG